MSRTEWERTKPRREAARARAAKRPEVVKRLLREWRFLGDAVLARWRGDTVVFEIGQPFVMGERLWVCTDVGSRTICAVRLDELVGSGDSGPPYSIVEKVLDGYDMESCERAPTSALRSLRP